MAGDAAFLGPFKDGAFLDPEMLGGFLSREPFHGDYFLPGCLSPCTLSFAFVFNELPNVSKRDANCLILQHFFQNRKFLVGVNL